MNAGESSTISITSPIYNTFALLNSNLYLRTKSSRIHSIWSVMVRRFLTFSLCLFLSVPLMHAHTLLLSGLKKVFGWWNGGFTSCSPKWCWTFLSYSFLCCDFLYHTSFSDSLFFSFFFSVFRRVIFTCSSLYVFEHRPSAATRRYTHKKTQNRKKTPKWTGLWFCSCFTFNGAVENVFLCGLYSWIWLDVFLSAWFGTIYALAMFMFCFSKSLCAFHFSTSLLFSIALISSRIFFLSFSPFYFLCFFFSSASSFTDSYYQSHLGFIIRTHNIKTRAKEPSLVYAFHSVQTMMTKKTYTNTQHTHSHTVKEWNKSLFHLVSSTNAIVSLFI